MSAPPPHCRLLSSSAPPALRRPPTAQASAPSPSARRASPLTRRTRARSLEETDTVTVTPFEKNLQVWRQLWRVLERSDLVRATRARLPPAGCPARSARAALHAPGPCSRAPARWRGPRPAQRTAPPPKMRLRPRPTRRHTGVPSGRRQGPPALPLRGPRGLRARGAPPPHQPVAAAPRLRGATTRRADKRATRLPIPCARAAGRLQVLAPPPQQGGHAHPGAPQGLGGVRARRPPLRPPARLPSAAAAHPHRPHGSTR